MVVSHDRAFMDRVCTFILELSGDGAWQLHAGNWSEGQARVAAEKRAAKGKKSGKSGKSGRSGGAAKKPKAAKLSYMEQRRLDGIEVEIEAVDAAVSAAEAVLADPAVVTDYTRLQPATKALEAATNKRDRVYAEWGRLEAKQASWLAESP